MYGFLCLSFILLLSGCFQSEEKALEDAKESAEEAFTAEAKEVNQTIDQISLYLEEEMEINGSSNNNVFLEKNGQDYLLFYNQFEDESSKHLYESIKQRPDPLLLESFQQDNKFGYIAIFPHAEEEYELQVGVGAVKKVTTIVGLDELETEAHDLMEMLQSIVVNK